MKHPFLLISIDQKTGKLEIKTSGTGDEIASMIARAAIQCHPLAEILDATMSYYEILDSEQSLGFENEIYTGGKELPN